MTDLDTSTASDHVPRRIRPSVVLGAVFLAILAGFWGWIWFYQLSNQGEVDMPDRLDDLAWTANAADICDAAHARVDELPAAHTTADAHDRADVIDAATAEYQRMLTELAAVAPTGSDRDSTITAAWLGDYRIYLDDRTTYADALRNDPSARFVVTEKYGGHITDPIDRFARVNEMEPCMSPGDV